MMSRYEDAIKIIYADNHLLALFKPAGMLIQGDRTGEPSLLDWAKGWVKTHYEKPGKVYLGLVHRLDRPVPGIVVFARTSKAAARLSEQFRKRLVKKIYWAVIPGRLRPGHGITKVYLARKGTRSVLTSPRDAAGKQAVLSYNTIDTTSRFSLLEVELITGRRHQIRAQLAAMGHPIVGDYKYGSRATTASTTIALLAKRLTCRHPTRPAHMTFISPLPQDWPWPPNATMK